MKPDFSTHFLIIISLLAYSIGLRAHEIPVHEKMTGHVVDSASAYSSAYRAFLAGVASDCDEITAKEMVVLGSNNEDFKAAQDSVGGNRSVNHFYDPFTGLGLKDFPFAPKDEPYGQGSFNWASTRDCPGKDTTLLHIPCLSNVGTKNIWSWKNARDYEWDGLTAPSKMTRSENLQKMFRAVGQVVHLLEDASQPQHVRDEQHLDKFPCVPIPAFWRSPIEHYGAEQIDELIYQHGMLDWKQAGFTKLEDFWNRHLYNGDAAILAAEANNELKLGMAEWANGNFIGERHIYAEWMITTHFDFGYRQSTVREEKKPGWYPYPSRDKSTNYEQVKAGAGKKPITLKDGTVVEGDYVSKIAAGVPVTHHSRLKFLGAKQIKGVDSAAICTIDDPKVQEDYHAKVIPKAIEYSAGLLDYFFRGRLETTVAPNTGGGGTLQLTIRNVSGQDLQGGAFHLFWDDTSGNRSELTTTSANGYFGYTWNPTSLDDNATVTATFTPPTGVTVSKYTLVYKGTIGTSGSNYDPQDSVDADSRLQ